ncbi:MULTISPECIES: T9SS type A sorting domain-containing protein [Niastella]|uniref:T9SS type A sorting domain-containing protein n=1 Tax=Niastella soli TaxID=2821487 RepID=A0ABS3YNB1_9BACT|nr:T9SS type A sorting domain-containing protein [Niastella soli]MBO9198746.1 T9SS type A sorting domain-containing protein [Niastella soli]
MQKRIPKPFSLLLFFVLLSNYLSATPECPIITGRFSQVDGTTTDASATGWYLDASSVSTTGYFAVKSNRLHAQELGGEGIWYSRVFSTAGYSDFQVAVKVTAEGDMNSSEYVKIFYKINGGAETPLDSRTGNFGTLDFISGTLTGSNVQLVVKIYNYNNGGTQTSKYYIEEYRVFKEKGPCALSAINVTAAAANGGILTCINSSLGLSATATGTGTTTWSWSGPNGYTSTAQNPTITTAGTYTVVASNSTGTGSASVTVTENKTAPVITATGGALACGSCVSISATSNVSGATYKWTGPNSFSSTSQNPTVCTAGTYTVTVTNPANGCSAQQSVSVAASAISTFWLEDFAGLANGTTSDAGTTQWSSSSTGTVGTYSVQNNEFKVSYTGQAISTWTSQAIDISTKTNVSFSVDLRSELASTNDAFETTDYIRVYYKLNGGAETLAYEDLAGIGTTTNTTGSMTFTSPTLSGNTLQVIIRMSNSDPTERYFFDNIKLTGSNAGTTTITPSVTGTVTCTASAQLSATASSTVTAWSWTGPNSFSSTLQNPVVNAGGQYIVTATLASGCTVTATTTVTENKTAPTITATGGTLACLSGITLNVNSSTNGATYSWSGPNGFTSTSKNPVVSTAGTYTATVTNPANGCTASQSVAVTAGGTTATFWSEDFTLANGTTSDAGATSWSTTVSPTTAVCSVLNNEIRITNCTTTGQTVWTSGVIDITGKTNVSISSGVRSSIINNAVMNGTGDYADYIRFYYKLNNGTEVLFAEKLGIINNHSTTNTPISSAGLTGTSLQIVVRARATGNDEFYYFDNMQVNGTTLPLVNALATATNILNCTNTNIGLTGSSTASGVSYSWTGPNNFTSTTQNPSVSTAGIYTLTVTDPSTGCTGSDTALVSLNKTEPGATASVSGPLTCNTGSSATLSGTSPTSGVSYNWTGPNNFNSTAQNPVVSKAGTYNLTVTNPLNGCTSNTSVTVTFSNTISATWLEDFTLANGTTSDNGATSWSVTKNPTTALISVLNNELRISNCTTTGESVWTSASIDITQKTNIAVSTLVRSSIINNAVMNETGDYADYIRFYYKLDNGNEVLFAEKKGVINNHSTTPTALTTAIQNGTYTSLRIIVRARATGDDEFYYFDNMQVVATGAANITANATGGAINCLNNSVTLQGSSATSGANYTWSGPDGFTSTLQNPVVTKPGDYILTVAVGSCTASASATVSQDTTRPAVTASHTGSITCITPNLVINGTVSANGTTYSWTGPNGFTATILNPTISKGGTYILKATNAATGCDASANTIVEENTVHPGEISINNSGIITCLTSSVTISGSSSSSDVNYKWEGPRGYLSSSSSATVTYGGLYTLTATNQANGCTSSKSTNVAENTAAPVVTIANNSPISCANPIVTLSAITTTPNAEFLWLGPDFVDMAATTTTSGAGTYIITVTDPINGCNTIDFTEVTEDYSDCGARKVTTAGKGEQTIPVTGVSNFTYKAYPNPVIAYGVIEFTSPQNALTTISLYNALGACEKVLFKGMATANRKYQVTIPATEMKAGAYYYLINTDGKSYTGKLMLVK